MSALWMPSIWISKPCASWPVLLRTSKFASDPTIATDCARAATGASRVVSARPSAAAKRARERMTCTGLSLLRASGAARRGRRASAMPDRTRAVSWISAMRRSGKQWRSREVSRARERRRARLPAGFSPRGGFALGRVRALLRTHRMRGRAGAAQRRREVRELAEQRARVARVDDLLDPERLGGAGPRAGGVEWTLVPR